MYGKLTDEEWQAFKDLSIEAKLYKEFIVLDERGGPSCTRVLFRLSAN